jgi:hypothetical protein
MTDIRPVSRRFQLQTVWEDELEEIEMAAEITIRGQKAKKGERMTGGNGWRLATTKGKKRVFAGTLIGTVNRGKARIAIFSVPK